jgi:hypothetical protein
MDDNHYIQKRSDDLIDKSFLGTVEDSRDPNLEGRCKVRVFGIHSDDLPIKDLPWAYPKGKSLYFGKDGKAGAISIPKDGSVVSIRFDNGNIYSPEYFSVQELADDIKDELGKDSEYHGSHFLLFDGDEELKIWFTKEKGITMQLKGSRVNIGQDKIITIEHDQTQSIITLEGSEINIVADSKITASSQSKIELVSNNIHINGNSVKVGPNEVKGAGVLGDQLAILLTAMATAVDAKFPPTPGALTGTVESMKELYLSKSVKITS